MQTYLLLKALTEEPDLGGLLEGLVARQDFLMYSERSGSVAYTPHAFLPFITYEAWICL